MNAPRASDVPTTSAVGDPRIIDALEEYLAAARAGHRPDRAEFLSRHAEIAGALADCLGGLDFMQEAGSLPLDDGSGIESEAAIAPAAQLGDFRIARELGRGGMGIVYEAEQISLGRRVALKVLPFAAAIDPRRIRRFQVEAQAAAHLHHPHIVAIFAVGCDRGVHYYAMQFIEGRTLATVIDDLNRTGGFAVDAEAGGLVAAGDVPTAAVSAGPHSPGRSSGDFAAATSSSTITGSGPRAAWARYRAIARLGIQAAEALEHAHALGVLHRDIKPANLMIDADGDLWVTDFGLARFHDDVNLTRSGDLLGTLRYMSPEQARAGGAIVDQRTDIYSLGATLYELATLRPAFDGRDRHELLRRVTLDEPTSPRKIDPTIPRDLETILLKAMSKDPATRYAAARDLADDLRRFQEHKPIRARRPTPVEHLAKWARRHRPAVAATSIALLLAMAIASVLLWREQRETAKALADLEAIQEKNRATLPQILDATYALNMLTMQTFTAEHHDPNAPSYQPFYKNTLTYYEGLLHLTAGDTDPRMREVSAKALYGRGVVKMSLRMPGAQDDYRDSIAAFDILIREQPERRDLQSSLALTLWFLAESFKASGRIQDAEPPMRRAIGLERDLALRYPTWPEHHQNHASYVISLADMLSSAAFATGPSGSSPRALETEPSNSLLLNAFAWLLSTRPDVPPYDPIRALDLADRAVAIDPKEATFWNTLGVARLRNGRPDAAEAFQRSLDAGSSGKQAYDLFPMAVIYVRRGDASKARQLYDQAVEWTHQHPSKDPDLLQLQGEARMALGLPKPGEPKSTRTTGAAPAHPAPTPPAG